MFMHALAVSQAWQEPHPPQTTHCMCTAAALCLPTILHTQPITMLSAGCHILHQLTSLQARLLNLAATPGPLQRNRAETPVSMLCRYVLNYTVTDSLGLSAEPLQLTVIVYESAQVQASLQLINQIPFTGGRAAARAQALSNMRQLTDASGSTANGAFRFVAGRSPVRLGVCRGDKHVQPFGGRIILLLACL